jgi:hypothetical protein
MILVIMYVETFKIDVIVFISVKQHNVMSHWPIFSSILVTKLMLAISHQSSYIKPTNQRRSFQILIYCKPSIRREMLSDRSILYSYLMGVDAINQTIRPEMLGMTKCSIAWSQRPNAIEHLVITSTEGQIVWSIASTPIK